MRRLKIQEHDELPSRQQLQALMREAQNRVVMQGDPISPLSFLITLLIILNEINTAHSEEYSSAYWAYFPDPPLLQPVVWEGRSIPIYTNDTVALGGFSDKHIIPNQVNFSYHGVFDRLPICLSRYFNSTGCLFVGEARYANSDSSWNLDIPGVTKESGTPQRRNGTGPLDIPFCDFGTRGRVTAAPWKLCRDGTATVYNIFGTNESLWDWSPDSARNPGAQDNRNFASRIWNLGGSKVFQTEIWKLAAALGCEGSYLQVGSKVRHGYLWNLTMRYPRTCVPHPYALLVGSVKIQPGLRNYNVTCNNCTLTNCVRGITNQTRVLVLRQPAFVMVPVKINGSWYDERGLELWREVEGALMRYRRGIGLIILGFVALVTLTASSITAALSLAQSVQTATFVNNLAQNASVALGTQEDIDKKLEDRLNALYDVAKCLGEEVQSIKLRLWVQCHADF